MQRVSGLARDVLLGLSIIALVPAFSYGVAAVSLAIVKPLQPETAMACAETRAIDTKGCAD